MRRPVIGLLCGVMLLGMLACGAYALSGGDSLISLSYLTGTFMPKAVSTGNEAAEKPYRALTRRAKKASITCIRAIWRNWPAKRAAHTVPRSRPEIGRMAMR